MKKIKLLPSIIMIALCLAVLGIGVYSATTGSNTISGRLTVNSAGHEVDIAVYEYTGDSEDTQISHSLTGDSIMYGNLLGSATGSRAGKPISLSGIAFKSDTANTFADVKMIDLVVAVTNKSSSDIGVYFWDGVGTKPTQVTASLIDDNHVVYGHQNLYADADTGHTTAIVDAEYSFYHHIPGCVASSTEGSNYGDYNDVSSTRYYTEFMHVYLMLKEAGFTSDSKTITLTLNLNVEAYEANFTSSNVSSAPSYSANTFVKMEKGITSVCFAHPGLGHNDTIKYVVLPYGMTNTSSDGGLFGHPAGGNTVCANMKAFSLPTSITTISSFFMIRSSTILSAIIPHSVTSVGTEAIMDCTGLTTFYIPKSVAMFSGMSGCTNITKVYMANYDWWFGNSGGTRDYKITDNLSDPSVAATRAKALGMGFVWWNSAS